MRFRLWKLLAKRRLRVNRKRLKLVRTAPLRGSFPHQAPSQTLRTTTRGTPENTKAQEELDENTKLIRAVARMEKIYEELEALDAKVAHDLPTARQERTL
jgi:hypothetical protein